MAAGFLALLVVDLKMYLPSLCCSSVLQRRDGGFVEGRWLCSRVRPAAAAAGETGGSLSFRRGGGSAAEEGRD
jgi:hypothetical protein